MKCEVTCRMPPPIRKRLLQVTFAEFPFNILYHQRPNRLRYEVLCSYFITEVESSLEGQNGQYSL